MTFPTGSRKQLIFLEEEGAPPPLTFMDVDDINQLFDFLAPPPLT